MITFILTDIRLRLFILCESGNRILFEYFER